jgi:small subunit ribosomal protein S7
MPRRAAATIRVIEADPVHGSRLVQQVINKVMVAGKKSLSEQIVYDALEILSRRSGKEPVESLEASISALTPNLEVRSRRVGGATYQVPVEVKPGRSTALALRWLVGYSKARREKTMTERLQNEILDASNGLGAAVKRREDTHKMAESNKAFAHYRW